MSSIIATPTINVATVVTVTATVTASPPAELFINGWWGGLSCLDMLLALAGLWTALIVGFNRLSLMPVIVPIGAAIGNGLLFIVIREQTAGKPYWHPFNYLMMNVAFAVQHYGCNFYTFFILSLLLSRAGRMRKVFRFGFWFLLAAHIGISVISATSTALVWKGSKDKKIKKIEENTYPPGFMTLASLELWGAGFLIWTLYRERRNARRLSGGSHQRQQRVGLLRQLAQSTEIRLATLASVGITRAGTGWTWYAVPSPAINVTIQIDNFAVLMENVYPVLLIIDLLAARINGPSSHQRRNSAHHRAEAPRDAELGIKNQQPGGFFGGRRPRRVAQTLDSVRRDFGQYLGKTPHQTTRKDSEAIILTEDLSTSATRSLGSSKVSNSALMESRTADEVAKDRIDEYTVHLK